MTVHVADTQGNRLIGASVTVQQNSKDFPLGAAISNTLLGNPAMQVHFYFIREAEKYLCMQKFTKFNGLNYKFQFIGGLSSLFPSLLSVLITNL